MDQSVNTQTTFGQTLRNLVKRAASSAFVQQLGETIKQELPHLLNIQAMSATQLQDLSDEIRGELTSLTVVCRREQEALAGRNGRDQAVLEMAVAQLETAAGRLEYMLGIYAEALQHSDPRMVAIRVENGVAPAYRSGSGPVLPRLSGGQRRRLAEQLRSVLANAIAMATIPAPVNGTHSASTYATAGTIKQLHGLAVWLRRSLDHCYEDVRIGVK